MADSTRRFSSRVDHYRKSRPNYPPAVLEILKGVCGLKSSSVIADVGSGTGILTKLFLKNGNLVYAVEPNLEMRGAGERLLSRYHRFHSVAGSAESTTLAPHCVDFITAGQAFHWFDREKARVEFSRILKPGGWVILIWNERQTMSTPFLSAYEQLLRRYSVDYEQVDHRRIDRTVLTDFYGNRGIETKRFPHRQVFNYDSLKGRLLSSSYTPEQGHPQFEAMIAELAAIFRVHQVQRKISFEYVTLLYYGQLTE
jgi:SAM-dependent methyltransferase